MLDRRRRLGIAGALGGLALGAAAIGGVVYAQTAPGGSPHPHTQGAGAQAAQAARQQFLNDLAANLKVDPATLQAALNTTASQEVDKALAAGKLSPAEAQKAKDAISSGKGGPGAFGGFGWGRPGGGAGSVLGQYGQQIQTAVQGALTSTLGETSDQLHTDLRSGKTIDQIATAHGTNAQAVHTAVADAVKKVLDPLVPATITADQETAIVKMFQNSRGAGFAFGAGGHPGPRGGHGPAGSGANGTGRHGTPNGTGTNGSGTGSTNTGTGGSNTGTGSSQ